MKLSAFVFDWPLDDRDRELLRVTHTFIPSWIVWLRNDLVPTDREAAQYLLDRLKGKPTV